jgi:hypothetical protein
MKTGRGYAIESWYLKKLTSWALPTKQEVEDEGWPSPEDKIVRVRIIKESDYHKLIKNQKERL